MIRYGVWNDGSIYGHAGCWFDNLERWDNLDDVHISLIRRSNGNDRLEYMKDEGGTFIPDPERSGWFDIPAVDGQFIDLCTLDGEPYERLSLGPRKGLRRKSF